VTVFADSAYWIALLNPNDKLHGRALEVSRALGRRRIVTTDAVLVEVLNFVSQGGERLRGRAVALVTTLLANANVSVVPSSRDQFLDGVELYGMCRDKGYSQTDCISFVVMRERGIKEALAEDHHFEQEGFSALLR
jgi:uncharacterized protein